MVDSVTQATQRILTNIIPSSTEKPAAAPQDAFTNFLKTSQVSESNPVAQPSIINPSLSLYLQGLEEPTQSEKSRDSQNVEEVHLEQPQQSSPTGSIENGVWKIG